MDSAIQLLNNWGQSLVPSVAPATSYKYNQNFGMSMSTNERYYSFTQLGRGVCLCQSVKSDICKLADLFSFMNQIPRYSVNVALFFYTMALLPFLFKVFNEQRSAYMVN